MKKTIYVLCYENRNVEFDVDVFETEEKARLEMMKCARKTMKAFGYTDDDTSIRYNEVYIDNYHWWIKACLNN